MTIDAADLGVGDLVAEASAEATALIGGDRVLRGSAGVAMLLGLGEEQLVGGSVRDLLPLRTADGGDFWARTGLLVDPSPRLAATQVELTLPGADPRPLVVSARLIWGVDGAPLGVLLALRPDPESSGRGDELVGVVSHELRSPLTGVKGYLATVLAHWDRLDDDRRRALLTTAEQQLDRALRLLADLLDASRLEGGALLLHRQPLRLETFLGAVVERVAGADAIAVAIEPPELEALGDADRLEQVVRNLLENALRYGAPPVALRAAREGAAIVLEVSDAGGPIPEEVLRRLFDKFFRAPESRTQGSGLGLFITRGIVEAHGGTLAAASDDAGTRFRVTLPG